MVGDAVKEAAEQAVRFVILLVIAIFIGGIAIGALLHSCATAAPARNAGEVDRG